MICGIAFIINIFIYICIFQLDSFQNILITPVFIFFHFGSDSYSSVFFLSLIPIPVYLPIILNLTFFLICILISIISIVINLNTIGFITNTYDLYLLLLMYL